mgnify:CR=1 FL=1
MPRPKKYIDQNQFESLCAIQCTLTEICNVLGVTDKTLNAWCRRTYRASFSEVFKTKRDKGKVSLRRLQYKAAEAGNVTMLIWLGKQWLDQVEKPQKPDDEDDISDEIEDLLQELDE